MAQVIKEGDKDWMLHVKHNCPDCGTVYLIEHNYEFRRKWRYSVDVETRCPVCGWWNETRNPNEKKRWDDPAS